MRCGDLVPLLRPTVTTFGELVNSLRRVANYCDPENLDIDAAAALLDSARPQVAFSPPAASELMDYIGRNVLLSPEYWATEVGLREIGPERVTYVFDAMRRNGAQKVRQSEFWEYARGLPSDEASSKTAQVIRTELTIASHGSMAASVGIPPSLPAFAMKAASRLFESPTLGQDDLALDGSWINNDEIDLLTGLSLLSPDEIYQIRGASEYENYIGYLEASDRIDVVTLDHRRALYLKWLATAVNVILDNLVGENLNLASAARFLRTGLNCV
jgi:hypothetical protein